MTIDVGIDLGLLVDPVTGVCDLDPSFPLVEGVTVIAQALLCRFSTALLFYAPGDSVDIRMWLSRGVSPTDVTRIQAQLAAQATEEETVESATVTLAPSANVPGIWTLTVGCVSSIGPFEMVMSATSASVALDALTMP